MEGADGSMLCLAHVQLARALNTMRHPGAEVHGRRREEQARGTYRTEQPALVLR